MRTSTRSLIGTSLVASVVIGTAALSEPPVAHALETVAMFQMNETSSGTNRVMTDSGSADLDGRIGDSIVVGGVVSGSNRFYRWNYTPPDTGPKDDQRLATVDTDEYLNPGTSDYAVEFRYRTTASSGNIVQKGQNQTNGGYWKVDQAGGLITCLFKSTGTNSASAVAPSGRTTNDGQWHTIRCVKDATSVSLYIDGVRVHRRVKAVGSIANSKKLTIGGKLDCNQGSVGCDYFTGDIDYVRIEKDVPAFPNDPPTMDMEQPVCVSLTCTFDSSGSVDDDGVIIDRAWEFGDGSSVAHQDVVAEHTFPGPGDYEITLTGTDDDGASDSVTASVSVSTGPNEPPVAAFTASCTAFTCSFDSAGSTDADGTIVARVWDFGDGRSASGANPVIQHIYDQPGSYTVRLQAVDDDTGVGVAHREVATSVRTSKLVSLPPDRVFDTRPGEPAPGPKGVVTGGSSIDVKVTGVAGVPKSGVSAVAINITAIGIQAPSYVAARPAGTPESSTSSLNIVLAGQVRANLVIVPVSAAGSITLSSLRDAHLVGDIAGYFTDQNVATSAGRVVTQAPQRLFDTRPGAAPGPKGRIGARETITVPVLGMAGVPTSGVAAVVLNVTATAPSAAGFVTVFPGGTPRPTASAINVNGPGETVPNQVIVPVGADGTIRLYSLSSTHLLADVLGYVTSSTAASARSGLFVPITPNRVFDTRPGEKAGGPKGLIPAGGTIAPKVAGVAGVPANAGAVVLNVTMIGTAPSFATIWPSGAAQPGTSNVNVGYDGDVRPNATIVRLATDGTVSGYVSSAAHLLADASGYFLG